jgi:hypothetical protein
MDLTFKIVEYTRQENLSDGQIMLRCGFKVIWSDDINAWFPSKAKALAHVNNRLLTTFGL